MWKQFHRVEMRAVYKLSEIQVIDIDNFVVPNFQRVLI